MEQGCKVTLWKGIHTGMGKICEHFYNQLQVSLHRYLAFVYDTFMSATWIMIINLGLAQVAAFSRMALPSVLVLRSNQFLPGKKSVGLLSLTISNGVWFTGEADYFKGCHVAQRLKVKTDITSQNWIESIIFCLSNNMKTLFVGKELSLVGSLK